MLNNFRLRTQLAIAFALIIFIFLVVGVFVIKTMLTVTDKSNTLLKTSLIAQRMLEARRHEKNYLLRGEIKYLNLVEAQIKQIESCVQEIAAPGGTEESRVLLEEIARKSCIYKIAFKEMAHLSINQKKPLYELDETEQHNIQAIVAAARSVLLTAEKLQQTQKASLNRIQKKAVAIMTAGFMAASVMGIFFAIFISRGIVSPIRQCAFFAQGIAKGDFNQTIQIHSSGATGILLNALKDMQMQLKRRIGFSEGILKGLPTPCAVIDTEEKITFVNRPMLEFLEIGGEPSDYLHMSLAAFFYNDPEKKTLLGQTLRKNNPVNKTHVSVTTRKGNIRHAILDLALLHDLEESLSGGFAVITDVTQLKEQQEQIYVAHNALRSKSQELELILHNVPTQVWYSTHQNLCLFANRARTEFLGKAFKQIKGKAVFDYLPEKEARQCAASNAIVMETKKNNQTEEWRTNYQKERRLLSITKIPKLDSQKKVEFIVTAAEDVTEQRQLEAQLRYKSYHDELTGLYNRHFLLEEMGRLQKGRDFPVAVIFCDVDGLKVVNDTMGHVFGDKLLIFAADLMKTCFRGSDIVSRYGGDEFVVLLPNSSDEDARNAVERLNAAIFQNNIRHPELPLSISMGFSVSNSKAVPIEEVLSSADNHMYQEKKLRKASARAD